MEPAMKVRDVALQVMAKKITTRWLEEEILGHRRPEHAAVASATQERAATGSWTKARQALASPGAGQDGEESVSVRVVPGKVFRS